MHRPFPMEPELRPDPPTMMADVAIMPMGMDRACGPVDPVQAANDFIQAQQALGASWGEAVGTLAEIYGHDAATPLMEAELERLKGSEARMTLLDRVAKTSPALAQAWLHALMSNHLFKPWRHMGETGWHLGHRGWITSLPTGLHATKEFSLEGCTSLQALPHGLRADENLILHGCIALKCLPEGLKVGQGLWMNGCTALEHVPSDIQVGNFFTMHNCIALKTLPDGLTVGWDLSLNGCTALTHLPRALQVDQNLNLRGCASWDGQIPLDASVRKRIFTDSHANGIPLAEWRELHPNGERAQGRFLRV